MSAKKKEKRSPWHKSSTEFAIGARVDDHLYQVVKEVQDLYKLPSESAAVRKIVMDYKKLKEKGDDEKN